MIMSWVPEDGRRDRAGQRGVAGSSAPVRAHGDEKTQRGTGWPDTPSQGGGRHLSEAGSGLEKSRASGFIFLFLFFKPSLTRPYKGNKIVLHALSASADFRLLLHWYATFKPMRTDYFRENLKCNRHLTWTEGVASTAGLSSDSSTVWLMNFLIIFPL